MSSPKVGDVLTTIEQLDACPTGTIVRYSDFWVFVRRDDGEWDVTGAYNARSSTRVFYAVDEVTVIWVPAPTRAEIAIDAWQIDTDRVSFPCTPGMLTLLRSVLVGDRVRVTVERIGDDDV